jgi:O-acetyl-ADP-ribose deacetylase (regulator of RNase III)
LGNFELIKGDLIEYLEDKSNNLICHIVNDSNSLGGGVAKVLADKWPDVKSNYHKWFNGEKVSNTSGDPKLGEIQYIGCKNYKNQFVVNMVGQSTPYGPKGQTFATKSGKVNIPPIRLESLRQCMYKVAEDFLSKDLYSKGYKIVSPQFGCGLAGSSFKIIKGLIDECWLVNDIDVTILHL